MPSVVPVAFHGSVCACAACRGASATALFADVGSEAETTVEATAEVGEVPAAVEALDGIESNDEAHNAERPARAALKKKPPRGKPLAEFSVGDVIKGKVKSLASYGAFVDIGAATDGLLHISQLSVGFVADVKEILTDGQDVEVRITKIDAEKNQVALTLLSEVQEEEAKDSANAPRPARAGGGGGGGRRDDSAVLAQLQSKGWSTDTFVEGTVASTVDFGCFVRVDASLLNAEVTGEMDGLVHISALSVSRVSQVTNLVNAGDKVQVRVKAIENRKVSLSMISPEDEQEKNDSRGGGGGETQNMGAKDWKESLEKMKEAAPAFTNKGMVIDSRK
jgi:predicted RNA-binding protein with RPS1 domain